MFHSTFQVPEIANAQVIDVELQEPLSAPQGATVVWFQYQHVFEIELQRGIIAHVFTGQEVIGGEPCRSAVDDKHKRILFRRVEIGWLAQDAFDLDSIQALPGDRLYPAEIPAVDLFTEIGQPPHVPFRSPFRGTGEIDLGESLRIRTCEREGTSFGDMEIAKSKSRNKLKQAQIERRHPTARVYACKANVCTVHIITEDTGFRPVDGHRIPIEGGCKIGHRPQAPHRILCPLDSLCLRQPQVFASEEHSVTLLVPDEQLRTIR